MYKDIIDAMNTQAVDKVGMYNESKMKLLWLRYWHGHISESRYCTAVLKQFKSAVSSTTLFL